MIYEFSMEKKTAIKLIAGMAVVGVLLFAAGVMVGVQWNHGQSGTTGATNVADAADPADKNMADKTADQAAIAGASPEPKQPVLKTPDPKINAQPQQEESALPQADALVEPRTIAPQTTATNPPAAGQPVGAKPTQDKPAMVQQPSSQPNYSVSVSPGAPVPDFAPVRTTYVVQIGAFLKEENAWRLREELERKGYSVSIHTDTDREQNFWYAVRLGSYTDQAGAKRAAANFTQQEKMKAIVRPSGIL
jgi:cell division protein FtsN